MVAAQLRPALQGDLVLGELASAVPAELPPAAAQVRVSGVALDSRRVAEGDLYAALPGALTHGARFTAAAVEAGAVAVLTDPEGAALIRADRIPAAGEAAATPDVPVLVVDDPRAALGRLSALVYGEPARAMAMVAVTGTNGKTTTTTLLEQALTATGARAGLVGTVCTRVAGQVLPSSRTTPEAPELHALLALMRERGVTTCAVEVSSHAMVLHRADGIVFDVAAFTNLSRDHLDFHPSMEEYFAAKASLFVPERARSGVVVVDDAWGRRLAEVAAAAGLPTTTLSTTGGDADWQVVRVGASAAGLAGVAVPAGPASADGRGEAFVLSGPGGSVAASSPLPGAFNTANTALALVILHALGTDLAVGAAALAGVAGVPGRMEVVAPASSSSPLAAPRGIVDYAHTPDAIAAALAALRGSTPGSLVVVLGAGGDRDREKRPSMGAAAAAGADVVVVTDDNPRGEVPSAIREAVLAGAREQGSASVLEVASRAEAVAVAVTAAARRPGSTVLVAGKGHEQGQEVAGVVHPFDDRLVLAAALAGVADREAASLVGGAR